MSQARSQTPLAPPGRRPLPQMLYQNAYVWFVFVSALDLMFTLVILTMGGREVNMVAAAVLDEWGVRGMVAFKFMMVVLIVLACEAIGQRRPQLGRRVANLAVALTAVPVVMSIYLLLTHHLY